MVAANLVTVEQQGRHRYYGIQNQEVAQIMETLLSITPPVEIRSLNQVAENEALRQARTCYDHLAGNWESIDEFTAQRRVPSEVEDHYTVTEKERTFQGISGRSGPC